MTIDDRLPIGCHFMAWTNPIDDLFIERLYLCQAGKLKFGAVDVDCNRNMYTEGRLKERVENVKKSIFQLAMKAKCGQEKEKAPLLQVTLHSVP